MEYVPYTQRHALTVPFSPSEDDLRFYEFISAYLQRDFSYGFPSRQKHLVGLILRKLLASSTEAVVATLEAIRARLLDKQTIDEEWIQQLIDDEDMDDELLEEAEADIEESGNRALEQNDKFFQQEREKLDAWAEDRIASAEKALKDTKLKLMRLKRQARMALRMEDAQRLQQDIRKTEAEQRRQRQEIFAVEDEIDARRDARIAALEKRLHRASRSQPLFTIRWAVV